MKIFVSFIFSILFYFISNTTNAQICNSSGNVVIFSNYDGSRETVAGRLNINVDVNIPNLKIGICSYERVTVNIGGAFAGNVTKVIYAGYNGTVNCNCYWPSTPAGCMVTSTVTGVAAGIVSYNIYPAATVNDPNGWPNIICAYQCAAGNQGGCNTAGQVVGYFLSAFGAGSTFRAHETQYSCWGGVTKTISGSGNCCQSTLPIELLYFKTACKNQNKRTFEWATASEMNNNYYTVEGSSNALHWTTLLQLNGAGKSSSKKSYSATSDVNTDYSYFRLKQTDFDGESKYSPIVFNDCENDEAPTIVTSNSGNGLVDLTFKGFDSETVEVVCTDVLGNIVLKKNVDTSLSNKESFSLENFNNGIYILYVKSSKQTVSEKLLKSF